MQNKTTVLVRTPEKGYVPLYHVARLKRGFSARVIRHEDSERIVNVKGELSPGTPSDRKVIASLNETVLPDLRRKYPGLSTELVGQQRDQQETFSNLLMSFGFALFVMFGLLAIPFRSYSQPLIIMSAIPFGFVGAVFGHIIMNVGLSVISIMGIIALAGVVVNNSLVLIDATNHARANGLSALDAILYGAKRRFRPILLTSLTTFFGLMPMILETSTQARFLIPMAISLGFGVLFSTFITLLIVPSLYLVIEDFRVSSSIPRTSMQIPKKIK